jgi:hypothetical protein
VRQRPIFVQQLKPSVYKKSLFLKKKMGSKGLSKGVFKVKAAAYGMDDELPAFNGFLIVYKWSHASEPPDSNWGQQEVGGQGWGRGNWEHRTLRIPRSTDKWERLIQITKKTESDIFPHLHGSGSAAECLCRIPYGDQDVYEQFPTSSLTDTPIIFYLSPTYPNPGPTTPTPSLPHDVIGIINNNLGLRASRALAQTTKEMHSLVHQSVADEINKRMRSLDEAFTKFYRAWFNYNTWSGRKIYLQFKITFRKKNANAGDSSVAVYRIGSLLHADAVVDGHVIEETRPVYLWRLNQAKNDHDPVLNNVSLSTLMSKLHERVKEHKVLHPSSFVWNVSHATGGLILKGTKTFRTIENKESETPQIKGVHDLFDEFIMKYNALQD